MTWLITGGCGFIATNLADVLLTRGEEVVILDDQSRVGSAENLAWLRARHGNAWRFEKLDVRDGDAVASLVKETKPDCLAHLAGQVAMTTSIRDPRRDFEVNVLGSLNVLEAVRLFSGATVVLFSSTNKVYGSLDQLRREETETRYVLPDYPNGLSEDLPLSGHSPYGCSKLAADQYILDYYRIYQVPTVVFRLSSIYGSRQFVTFDQGWVGWFIKQVRDDVLFTVSGTGKQVRDLLHVNDLCEAFLAAAEQPSRTAGRAFNMGGGPARSLSVLELLSYLDQRFGMRSQPQMIEWRKSDQLVFIANTRKFQTATGWSPRLSLADGLAEAVAWNASE